MTIETQGKPSKEFYGEYQAVRFRYKRLLKNPRKKIKSAVTTAISWVCALSVLTAMYIALCCYYADTFLRICTAILAAFDFVYIIFLAAILKQQKVFLNNDSKRIITVDGSGIKLENDKQNVLVKCSSIEYILVNKYTVCVLPDEIGSLMIVLSTEYRGNLLQAIEEYSHGELIIDNTDLYK